MKQSTAALFALLFSVTLLSACSREDSISMENPPAELADADTTAVADETSIAEANNPEEDPEEDGENADGSDAASLEDEPDTEGVEQKNVKLEVRNQETFGQIKVSKIATARDGWVSVHRSKEDGSIVLPDSIGEARVDSGDSEDVIVDLWEAPEVGEKLWVLLHIDAGERGKYEFPEKDLPVRRNGEMMARSFVVEGEEDNGEENDDAE